MIKKEMEKLVLLIIISMTMMLIGPASASENVIANQKEFVSALVGATGGETLTLAGGNYGSFALKGKASKSYGYSSTVTVRSADPKDPATFSRLSLDGVSNLIVDNIKFDYTYMKGDAEQARPFQVNNSSNIIIRNSVFDGDLAWGLSAEADGFGAGIGLSVRESSNVVVEGNEIYGFYTGLTMGNGKDYVARANNIHAMRVDGMNFTKVENVLIEDNYIHSFARNLNAGDHADMIQFWTFGNERPIMNVTIRNNILNIRRGSLTQGIFMANEAVTKQKKGRFMYYRNLIIFGNVVINNHPNGIVIGETYNLAVQNNSLIRGGLEKEGAARQSNSPRIRIAPASSEVVIRGNMSYAIPEKQPGWKVFNNLMIQDVSPSLPYYYTKVFRKGVHANPERLEDYLPIPGGLVEQLRIGSPLLLRGE